MELLIETEGGEQYRLLPAADLPPDLISEDRCYRVRLVGFDHPSKVAGCRLLLGDVSQDEGRLARLDELHWTWEVKDYAGRLTVGMEDCEGRPLLEVQEIVVDPNRNKLTREQFAAMIEEVSAEAAVAYSLSPATQRIELGQRRQSFGLAQLEYVRQQIRPLRQAVEAIARRPRKTLECEDECVSLARARGADDRSLAWLLRRTGELAAVSAPNVPAGARILHGQLQGHLPERLQVTRRIVTYDVYENQLIKHFLQRLAAVLRHTEGRLAETAQDRLLDDPVRRLAKRRRTELGRHRHTVHNLLKSDFLQDVGPLHRIQPVTQALRKDPLYARFYALYRRFERAITPFDGEPFRLSLEKTWQLYEYWCFFQVIAALRLLVGDRLWFDASSLVQVHADRVSLALPGAHVQINPQVRVHFQKPYGYYGWSLASDADRSGTYSHEMRPDISIEMWDKAGVLEKVIVLDPKYRVNALSLNLAMDDLHRYKDAIVSPTRQRLVDMALVLCPSAESAKRLYFEDAYIKTHGLGALELQPGTAGSTERLAGQLGRLMPLAYVE